MCDSAEAPVLMYWQVAEELLRNGSPTSAVLVLEGLLARPIPASMVEEEMRTRIRLADILLTEGLHPDLARRALEPARSLALHHSVSTVMHIELLRLLSVCSRRKHNFKMSVSCLQEALSKISAERKRKVNVSDKDIVAVEAHIHLELSRTFYSRLVENHFFDVEAASQLVSVSSVYSRFALVPETAAAAVTLCVCHLYGLLACGRCGEMNAHFQQANALFGSIVEISVLKGLVETVYGEAGPSGLPHVIGASEQQSAAEIESEVPASPLKKRLRSDSLVASQSVNDPHDAHVSCSSTSAGVVWLSEGALYALDQLIHMVRPTSGSVSLDDKFQTLVTRVDDQMRRLVSWKKPSADGSASSAVLLQQQVLSHNSELRFLVAIKVAAYCEVIATDLTRNNLVSSAVRLDALCQYLLLFHKHTAHFACHLHLLCGVLFSNVAVGLREDSDRAPNVMSAVTHFAAALATAVDPHLARMAKVFRCALWWSLLQKKSSVSHQSGRIALMERFKADMEDIKAAAFAHEQQSSIAGCPRLRTLVALLCGAAAIDEYDYPSAIAFLKTAAELARKCFGMGTPLLSSALRLLALAHHLAGAVEASDVALTTATQLSTRCQDASCLVHCLQWTMSRMVVECDADAKHRAQLSRSIDAAAEHLQLQLAHVVAKEETQRLRLFHPAGENAAYVQWLPKSLLSSA